MNKTLSILFVFALFLSFVSVTGFTKTVDAADDTVYGGYVDKFELYEGRDHYSIQGWAYNPEDPTAEVVVDVLIDNSLYTTWILQGKRSDVAKVTGAPDTPNAFNMMLETNAFDCNWSAEGECMNTNHVQLAVRDINTDRRWLLQNGQKILNRDEMGMISYIDNIQENPANTEEVVVQGWIVDPTYQNTNFEIVVMVDGQLAASGEADLNRVDVERAFNTGYGFKVPVPKVKTFENDSQMSLQIYAFSRNTYKFYTLEFDNYNFID